MNINRAQAMFGGMAAAKISHGREDLEEGRYVVLLQSILNMESTITFKPYIKFNGVVLYPLCDGANRTPDMDAFGGSPAGSSAEWVVNQSLYFKNEIKTTIVRCLGMTEDTIKEMEKGMTQEEINAEFFQYCLAMTGEEVQGSETVRTGPGIFDNTTTVEIRAVKTEAKPKANAEDNKPGKVYTNVRVLRKVPLSEVAEKATEAMISQAFGSFDNFANLLEAEG